MKKVIKTSEVKAALDYRSFTEADLQRLFDEQIGDYYDSGKYEFEELRKLFKDYYCDKVDRAIANVKRSRNL